MGLLRHALTKAKDLLLRLRVSKPSTMADLTRNPFQLDDNLFRRARYWSHELYRGIDNERVEIVYCTTRQKSESVAATFLKEPVVGFDMEWHPSVSYTHLTLPTKRIV